MKFEKFLDNELYSRSSEQICWICHQEYIEFNSEGVQTKKFSPCNCKGSLSYVHRKCLNLWFTENQNSSIKELINSMGYKNPCKKKINIFCPNCKYPLRFQLKEVATLNTRKKFNIFESREKVILLGLFLLQVIALLFDYCLQKKEFHFADNDYDKKLILTSFSMTTSQANVFIKLSNFLHGITVLIILGAAIFNIWEPYNTHFVFDIQDKNENITSNNNKQEINESQKNQQGFKFENNNDNDVNNCNALIEY